MKIYQPVCENVLIELFADIVRKPFDESRYDIKKSPWDYVAEEIEEVIQLEKLLSS